MNFWRPVKRRDLSPEATANVRRIDAMWTDCRARFGEGGPFLFGAFGAADAMYAPVVTRFITWKPELPGDAISYVQAVWEHPWLVEWRNAALAETWTTAKYETPGD